MILKPIIEYEDESGISKNEVATTIKPAGIDGIPIVIVQPSEDTAGN